MDRASDPRGGFTLIEVALVIVVGAILSGMAILGFSQLRGSMSVNSARGTFITMLATARATAVERGISMLFVADPDAGTLSIEVGCAGDGDVVQSQSIPVTMTIAGEGALAVCMTARGFANPDGNSFDDEASVVFTEGDRSLELTVLPLGQVVTP